MAVWALVAAFVAGCSSSSDDEHPAGRAAPAADELAGAGGGGAASGAGVVPQATGPRIVKEADLHVELGRDGVGRAVDRAASIAERHRGYVAATAVSHGDDAASATLTVRVPAAAFDAVRRALSELGEVTDERVSGDDVTGQLVDFDARIRSLQAQEDALRTLLGRANAVGEVLQVQSQLFEVRGQIEQLQAQRVALADAADFSTITLQLVEPGAPAPGDRPATGLARSFERAREAAIAVVGGMVVALGVALPLGALGGLGWLAWRLNRSRRRATVASSS